MGVRTATILVTDVVQSTRVFGALDHDRAHHVRDGHFTALDQQVLRHRGATVKTMGDGLIATFAAAGDALACAGAMQRAVAFGHGEVRLAMRVGIAAGDVREEEGDVNGPAVVVAARLCADCSGGQVLATAGVEALAGPAAGHQLRDMGGRRLSGIEQPVEVRELLWQPEEVARLRVVLADDAALVREGLARLLDSHGVTVAEQAHDVESVVAAVERHAPHVAVLDLRMPPGYAREGLEAAARIKARWPETGVLLLSVDVEPRIARRLVELAGERGVGYLGKERVAHARQLAAALRAIATGGIVLDDALTASGWSATSQA